ncbi:MAG TPA: glycosyltransferase family 2 protein [Polyangiaceae bacterium LLY-WYZ-15_(1-7)]|nr:glycosyltransferase family 2 protein [Polyangiaceae bacterium LLY-WYZ-15_(1-7)]HJL01638.1 glycosyltransferase family 2 protein [Polyangiaceae bacterium LLY-WYZ-15_(1-7)]HJL08678.1 glycosyltransferase family 2 protein [Polyangiaceae bacterium LLY-WYZ-15_(1-7)]HJL24675.1 glycosyltransferase family 2 protein [Polyangiaceae bacterium LLY-WYZ-15_(1-7)]HJL28573.1 glycosyltransferase family 2 protein [Polyangiaceae bacterium LLY-WYZ-15_(1-7)]
MDTLIIVLYLIALSILGIYGAHRGHLLMLYLRHRKKNPKPTRKFAEEELPSVTIQLPMFNEMYVVDRLLEGVASIDYPKDKLHLQILDDSTDETVQIARAKVDELCERGFDAEYIHRTDRTGYKAGALENGLKTAKGELVMVFDADFVPQADILRKLVDHFTDEKVGMVQARWGHLNREYSMLTRCQSMMLDGHFVIEHIARNRSGRFFNFNGTAGIWRKETIEDAGGWEHDTVTEDMDLSFRAQLKGWRFVYVPDALAPAELPCEMNSFKTQQFRWAKGSAQTTKKLLWTVLKADIPFKVKLEVIFHLTNNFAYLFLVVLALLQLPNMLLRRHMDNPELLLLDVPLFAATCGSICVFYLVTHRALYGNLWDAVKRLPLMMALGIGLSVNNARAVLEGLFGKDLEFVRTPKHGVASTSDVWKKKKYKARFPVHSLLELAFGLYFVVTIVLAVITGSWVTIPFLVLFMIGFLYVGALSLYQAR